MKRNIYERFAARKNRSDHCMLHNDIRNVCAWSNSDACRRFSSKGGDTTSRRRRCCCRCRRRSLTEPLSVSSWKKLQEGGRKENLRMRRKQKYNPHDVHADSSGMCACCRAGSGVNPNRAIRTRQLCHNSLALRLPAVACISPRLPDPIVMSWRNR